MNGSDMQCGRQRAAEPTEQLARQPGLGLEL
jgi:hypothetical protein